jgi:16S rRNA (cytosine967-C5)-methyltransferase
MHPQALLDSCADLLRSLLQFDHPADAAVARYFREHRSLGPRERATLTQTAFNVLRKKRLYEHLARSGSGPRERRLAILGFSGADDFLAAALNETEKPWAQASRHLNVDGLEAPFRHNLPDWLAERVQQQLGEEEFWSFIHSLEQPAALDLRVNVLKAKREDVRAALAAEGIETAPTPYASQGLRVQGKPSLAKASPYVQGACEVQDEGSQLLAQLVDAHRGEMVVDFCAGAGGKTLALGASMRNTGRLYAFDTSAHRLEALRPRLARSGLSNVHPTAIAHERDERIRRLSGKVDRVLVDAPCSGLGTLRRSPDLKWRQSEGGIDAVAATQTAILASASRLLKPGGRLVYATCSLLEQENEAIAREFASNNPDFSPVAVGSLLAHLKLEGAEQLCSGAKADFLRLWPHRHGTDGFFAAVWQKKA